MNNKIVVTFDDSVKEEVLGFFDKTVDNDGFIVEKSAPSQRVLSPDGQEVEIKEFAGIMGGSEIFLKSDLISIIELADKLKK